MTSNALHCHICQMVLEDNESKIKQHISSIHLNYRPYDCRTCIEKCNIFKTAMEEDMEAHIAASHSTTNSGYHVIKDQIKEAELKAAIEECRRVSISQLSPANAAIVWDHNPTLNSFADIDENVQVLHDSKEHLRRVFISLGDTSTDTESISTETKPEDPETSQDIALVSARLEIEQNRNAPTMDQILTKTMYDLIDCPTLNDYQATLLPVFDQPRESHEIAPNINFSHLNSINQYPSAISSDIMEIKCEIKTEDHFHGTIEEVQDSNVTHTSLTTDQVSDNVNTQLPEQNEIHTAVETIPSKDITATTTSMPILAEIPLLKRAVGPYMQIGSRASKRPIASQEPCQYEEMPLIMMGQKQIHSDFETGHDLLVERKRSRIARTEQILPQIEESDSVVTSLGDGQNQRQHLFGECLNENETDDEKSEYEWMDFDGSESDDEESGTNNDTLSNKTRLSTTYKLMSKASHKCELCPYSSSSGNRLKVHMRTHTGEKPFKCTLCSYASTTQSTLTNHIRTHTSEKPFKCSLCSYASAQSNALQSHVRTHTGENPYKCRFCSYACTQSNGLQEHVRTHTGEKPFKCSFCSYACTQSNDLHKHIRTHTGEKPYKCTLCTYACTTQSSLTTHRRTHTGDKPFKCSQCSFACAQSSYLKQHMRYRHSLDKK